jgi:hypothetical protein
MVVAGLQIATSAVQVATLVCGRRTIVSAQLPAVRTVPRFARLRHAGCQCQSRNFAAGGEVMDLAIGLPAMLLLGLAAVGLMILFVEACDKV